MPPLEQVEMPSEVRILHQEEKCHTNIFDFASKYQRMLKEITVLVVSAAAETAQTVPAMCTSHGAQQLSWLGSSSNYS